MFSKDVTINRMLFRFYEWIFETKYVQFAKPNDDINQAMDCVLIKPKNTQQVIHSLGELIIIQYRHFKYYITTHNVCNIHSINNHTLLRFSNVLLKRLFVAVNLYIHRVGYTIRTHHI